MSEGDNNNKANIVFNISGGNNQILPTATQAVQNFYSDKYIEEKTRKGDDTPESNIVPDSRSLSHYINNVGKLSYYVGELSACKDARALAQVVLEMRDDEDVKIDNEEMVKERFISTLLPLVPNVKTGISNIRQRINDEADRQRKFRKK